MLDYRIQTFLTLYDRMNYRLTAQALRMTQPGVTQHIQYLERHYGVKLFHYDGRQLTRTAAADALKRYANAVLAQERSLLEGFAQPQGIHIDVGATKTIGEFVLPPVLREFLQNPRHSIHFVIDNTENLLRMLENSQLDFAIIEGVFDKTRYGSRLMKRERFTGICAAAHPFAGRVVPLGDVFRETLILREPGSGTRHLLEQSISDRGYSLSCFARCVSASNFSVITDLVAHGDGVTFGYLPVAAHHNGLATFEVEHMDMAGEFNFVYCSESAAAPKIDLFFGAHQPQPSVSITGDCPSR